MVEKSEKKRLAILRILQRVDRPLSSPKITQELRAMGHEVSDRTIRLYLSELDNEGLTENFGKKGRMITERGLRELSESRVIEKIGFLAAKIDQMTYKMDFDLTEKSGKVIVNTSMIERDQLETAVSLIKRVFAAGYSMGDLVTLVGPGERFADTNVPEGYVEIGTVCSVTLNGVLLAHGIPTNSRFGGVLEFQNYKPTRFVELINYDGTTLDPLEVFIRSGMTDYLGAIETGNGRIGAGFREFPADSRDRVIDLWRDLEKVGLGGFLAIGWPGQPLLEIPVSEGRIGAIVIGGLNPVALLEEKGIRVNRIGALAGLLDYRDLFHYQKLDSRMRDFLV